MKEKESRKTQTFKKDDDKKKKLMQVEVQVGEALWHVCGRIVPSNVFGNRVMASVFNVLQNATADALIRFRKWPRLLV